MGNVKMSWVERYKQYLDLRECEEQTPEMCLEVVKNNGYALRAVRKQTHEICLAAVKNDGKVLKYVKDRTPEICLAAVQQNGKAITCVRERTPEICLAAVKNDGMAIARSVLEYTCDAKKIGAKRLCFGSLLRNSWR